MSPAPEYIDFEASLKDAAKRLASADIGAVPVCSAEGHLQGMVTDRDIVVKAIAAGKDPASTKVGDIADQQEVVTIGADDSVDEAIETMKRHRVRRLPVIDGTKLVGMVSQADIARALPNDRIGELVEVISS
jgi:CBS domain-containing protein